MFSENIVKARTEMLHRIKVNKSEKKLGNTFYRGNTGPLFAPTVVLIMVFLAQSRSTKNIYLGNYVEFSLIVMDFSVIFNTLSLIRKN